MIAIVIAIKIEAEKFIKEFNLKLYPDKNFLIYKKDKISEMQIL